MNFRSWIRIAVIAALVTFTGLSVLSQTSGSKTGRVAPSPTPTPQDEAIDADKLPVYFTDFEYEFPGPKPVPFKLRSGNFVLKNPKTKESTALNLRKTFFFDITGDSRKEAIVHILGSTCEMCDDKSLFYAFTAAGLKPVEVFRIAGGTGEQCGIKEIVFDVKSILVDTYGDCEAANGLISPVKGGTMKNKASRFLFEFADGKFKVSIRESIDLPEAPAEYRTQIRFGKP